jgi:hypothetical protein
MSKKIEDKVNNGGSMTTRHVLLLGGAALVLAACADSTAPGTQMRRAGESAFAKKDTVTTTRTIEATTEFLDCRGYQVGSGRTDSTLGCEGIQ